MIKLKTILKEETEQPKKFQLDILPGDVVLGGKFRNKPYVVAGFSTDDNNQPVIVTDKGKKVPFLSVRIKKLMPNKEKEND